MPLRIVSLVPSITEALCMLALEDALVGITNYCLHPADVVASKARVGGTKNPRIREIVALRPDLVIVNPDENRKQTFEQLQSLGLKVLVVLTDSLDQVEAAWLQLGEATNSMPLAQKYRDEIAAARAFNRSKLREIQTLPTLIPVWRDPWMASGSGTYIESLLSECGFRNVLAQCDRKWTKVAINQVAGDDVLALPQPPEMILLPSEPYPFGEADRDSLVELGFLREQILLVDGVMLSWWMSRTAAALKQFRELRMSAQAPPAEP
jgi:ABC-type Fe3+-hydroxamate transport system substrate-binding protein